MRTLALSLVVLLSLAATSVAQCPGGLCPLDRAPVRHTVVAVAITPARLVHAVRVRKPVRKLVARVATLPGRVLRGVCGRR